MAHDVTFTAAFSASRAVVSLVVPPALTLRTGSLLLPTETHFRVM